MGSQRSQAETTDVLSLCVEASQWTDEDIRQKLPSVLPIFKISFSACHQNENTSQILYCICFRFTLVLLHYVFPLFRRVNLAFVDDGLQAASVVIGSFLPCLEVEKETFKLLDVILPALQNFLTCFLEECVAKSTENIEAVNKTLQQSLVVLENCISVVQFLMQADSIGTEETSNIPKAFLHIINISLQHLSCSKDTYGDYIELIGDTISTLCHLAVDLSSKFAALIPKFTWDTFNGEDLEVLIFTCDELCLTASYLSELSNLRAFVNVWRTYASLVNQHHNYLITNLDMGKPVEALSKEIKNGFNLLLGLPSSDSLNDQNQKLMQRTLKTLNFCLKIVVSLCEKFRGYLRSAHYSLVSLLFCLFKFSPGNITLHSYPSQFQKNVESQTTIGIEPLLLHLRNDEEFVKTVLDAGTELTEEISEDMGSFLLLLIAVAVPASAAVMIHLKRFLHAIFAAVKDSHVSLSLPCKRDGVMYGGQQHSSVSLYEHILTRLCVLVANLDGTQFQVLEEVLIEWLLSGHLWPSLLVSDVWCFLARYGTSELCLQHCVFLLDILPHTVSYSQESLITASLLGRLVSKLTQADKEHFMCTFKEKNANPDTDMTILYSFLQENEATEVKDCKCKMMVSSIQNINEICAQQATDCNFVKLRQELELLTPVSTSSVPFSRSSETSLSGVEKEFADSLATLWERMPEKLMGATVVDHIVACMAHASVLVIIHFSNAQLCQILSLCRMYVTNSTPVVCIAIANFLEALGRITLLSSSEQESVLSLIAECMAGLLQHSNPLVQQFGLETFVSFGRHTVHENVLPMCLDGCSEKVQEYVTNYLQQEPHPIPSEHTELSIIQVQSNISKTMDKNNAFISISDFTNIANIQPTFEGINVTNAHEQSDAKKRKLNDCETYKDQVQSLLCKLHESQRLMREMKECGESVKPSDINEIKSCLKELLYSIDALE
ncbi:hypothetical protein SK128_021181 [Halocaridina rubra]|uniref:Uncharacterized protein n=1 Tax=Halocaridina rubra TaxID=373956 RepID=A0AAN8XNI2_HALRR